MTIHGEIVFFFFIVSCLLCMNSEKVKDVGTEFHSFKIVPDIISEAPQEYIDVTYPNNVKIELGNKLPPEELREEPQVTWNSNSDSFYVLCLVDANAPRSSNPKANEWLHWLVVNIPGCNVNDGETISEYVPIVPTCEPGPHRHVFLVYKQPAKMLFEEKFHKIPTHRIFRADFTIKEFAEKYNLSQPIAGNFFLADFEKCMPKPEEEDINANLVLDPEVAEMYVTPKPFEFLM